MRCETCRKEYTPSCDFQQGRCPNHPSYLDQVLADPYKSRFYNLFKLVGKLFK
jgi:hypothetical protein